MRVAPPAHNILGPIEPSLGGIAARQIQHRRPKLCGAIGIRQVLPVVAFPSRDIGLEIGAILRCRPERGVEMIIAIAPIGERPTGLHPDEIDIGIGPEWIERKPHLAWSGMMAVPSLWARYQADLRRGAEDLARSRCQAHPLRRCRIAAGPRAQGDEPIKTRPQEEIVHPTGAGREMGVMQDKAAQAPITGRPIPAHSLTGQRELRWCCRAKESGNLAGHAHGQVRTSRQTRCKAGGDPGRGGISGLRRSAGPGINARVIGRYVQHQHGGQCHTTPTRLDLANGGNNGLV